jgi:hypothetical protein
MPAIKVCQYDKLDFQGVPKVGQFNLDTLNFRCV